MRTILKRFLHLSLVVLVSSSSAFGQFEVVSDIIRSGKDDANKLLNAYLEPIGKGWGYTLGGGWYNTAKPHGLLGFNLTFSFNMATIPETGKTFDISTLGLEKITPATPGSNIFPTIANGDDVNQIQIIETFEQTNPATGQLVTEDVTVLPPTELRGFSIPFVPLPILSGGIGLIKNTHLAFRYIPTVGMGNFGELGMWGIGVKHDILQWIPVMGKIPFLQTSVFLGYSKLNFNFNLPYEPRVDNLNNYVNPENQKLAADLGAFHGALLIGVSLPVVSPYVSLGITSSSMTMDLLGEYALPKPRLNQNNEIETYVDPTDDNFMLRDPLSFEFNNSFSPSVAAGLRLKFLVFTLYGQYTYQEYSMISAGFGISFR